jgi:ABC-type oligopeptide transport system substrate-binding subunit
MAAMRVLGSGLLAASLSLAACGGGSDGVESPASSSAPAVALPTTPMADADAAKLDEVIEGVYTEDLATDFPGLWVGVWHPEKGAYVKAWGSPTGWP